MYRQKPAILEYKSITTKMLTVTAFKLSQTVILQIAVDVTNIFWHQLHFRTVQLIIAATLITVVNSQIPGLPDFGRTVARGRNLGRRIQDTPSDTRVQVQTSATPGRGRVILTQRNHPNIEQRPPVAQEEALENEWRDFKVSNNSNACYFTS